VPLRAVIFDVDGTLAETEEAHRAAFNRAFAEAGHCWHWTVDAYRDLLRVTGGQLRIRAYLDAIGEAATPDEIALLHRRKNRIYADLVESGAVQLRPGVARLIAEARRAGLLVAIATTTSRSNIDALLAHALPQDAVRFDAIFAGEDVTAKKPDPEVYQKVLAALGIAAGDAIAIEDSRNGLLAATACGIATVITPSVYSAGEDFTEARLVTPDLERPRAIDLAALARLIDEPDSAEYAVAEIPDG